MSSHGNAPLLEARGLSRRSVGDAWLLEDVNLSLQAGERLAVVGPSGSGKTLLLRAMALLDPLQEGSILWRGEVVDDAAVPAYRQRVMYLHQKPALFEGTVEENVRLPFTLAAYQDRAYDASEVVALLERIGRDRSFLEKATSDLSGGEAQVVALIRVLQLEPDVLLLDEVTGSLDAEAAAAVEQLLVDWLNESSETRAFVFVSHDAEQRTRLATRTVAMEGGQLREE